MDFPGLVTPLFLIPYRVMPPYGFPLFLLRRRDEILILQPGYFNTWLLYPLIYPPTHQSSIILVPLLPDIYEKTS